MTFNFEAFELPADPGQRMLVYAAEPGSPSHEALALLASWSSTQEAAVEVATTERTSRHA
jgi:hypothetical protein